MVKIVLALLCALLIAVFAVQNSILVVVRFLVWRFDVSLALVILGSTALGAVFVCFLGTFQLFRQNLKIREYKKTIQRLELQEAAEKQVVETECSQVQSCNGGETMENTNVKA